MESFVQISLKEYEKLKSESKKIPVNITPGIMTTYGNNRVAASTPVKIKIDLKMLKLQICDQNSIHPVHSVIEFY